MLQFENRGGSKLARHKKYMLVRYGRMGIMGWFEHSESQLPRVHTRVVIKTERGLEMGEVVGPYCYKAGQFRLSDEQVEKYYKDSGADQVIEAGGTLERFASAEDIHEEAKLNEASQEELDCCRRYVREMNLQMKVVAVEHIFGGERIIFYFIADGRVDFRELVKRLAKDYQTRIEMRQIGSRDEARLVGDYETCGLECCCKRFLKILKPVNMRMAKLQKATLDPSKISGHCGRLKCCLRYEDETYRELRDRLPRKNSRVKTAHGEGRVVDTQVLTQLVVIQADDGSEYAVPLEEVTVIGEPSAPVNRQPDRSRQELADLDAADEPFDEQEPQNELDETDFPDETETDSR